MLGGDNIILVRVLLIVVFIFRVIFRVIFIDCELKLALLDFCF